MPAPTPFVIEYVNGIRVMVSNAGMPTLGSRQSISETARIMKYPTMISTGADASASADALGAAAYTVGRDIVFGQGRYAPGSAHGRGLLEDLIRAELADIPGID